MGFRLGEISHRNSGGVKRGGAVVKVRGEDHAQHNLSGCIVAIAAERNLERFADLFTALAPKVKAFLIRRGSSVEEAEELTQETLLTIWRRADSFDPCRATAESWIFTIARNLRIDVQRRGLRAHAAKAWLEPTEVDNPTPEQICAASERARRIRMALEQLPSAQKDILHMVFFTDRAHGEVAEALDLPLGTVKGRVRLAMSKLRTLLDNEV